MPRRPIARWLLWGPLGLAVLYWVGANLMLSSRWLPRLIDSPRGTFAVEWRSAYTLWPGRVRVSDFRLRGRSGRRVEYEVRVGRAQVTVDLPALFHRQFHASRVRASDIAARIRFPLQVGEEAAPIGVRTELPEISGTGPPGPVALPPRVGSAPRRRPPWTVSLDNVRVERVTEVWVQQFRWQGEATVRGSFALQPLRRAQVGPAWAEFRQGEVRLGKTGPEVADHTQGSAHLFFRPFVYGAPNREGVARSHVNLVAIMAGAVPGFDWLQHFIPALHLAGTGALKVDLRVDGRLLRDGSRVDLQSEGAEVRTLGLVVRTNLQFHAWTGKPGSVVALLLSQGHLRAVADPRATADLGQAAAVLRVGPIDLASPRLHPSMELRLAGTGTRDLGAWSRAGRVPALAFSRGRARLDGELHAIPGGPIVGRLRLRARDLAVRVGGVGGSGSLEFVLRLRSVERRGQWADLAGGQLEVRVDRPGPSGRRATGWWARGEVVAGRLQLGPGSRRFTGLVRARARDARPLLDLLVRKGQLPGFVKWPFSLPVLGASAQLQVSRQRLVAEPFHLTGGRVEVVGNLRVQGQVPTGVILVHAGHLKAGLDLSGARARWRWRDPDRWFREQTQRQPQPPPQRRPAA